jgi:exopolysaccharide biosynthesis polyprenyl glycosylphosphotransferase
MYRRTDYAARALNLLQLLIDAGGAIAGFEVALWLYRDTTVLEDVKRQHFTPEGQTYYAIIAVYAALVLLTFTVKHLYHTRETGLMNMDEATAVLQSLAFSALAIVVGSYVLIDPHTTKVSRLIVGLGLSISTTLVLFGRAVHYKLRRYLQSRGHFFRRIVICGAGEAGRSIARKLLHSPKFHLLPVAFLDNEPHTLPRSIDCLSGHGTIPVAGSLEDVPTALREYDGDEIWIAMPGGDQDSINAIAQATREYGVPCRFVPNLFQIPLETLAVETVGGVPLLSIKPRPQVRPMPWSKRGFDIVFSLLVLLPSPILWPLIILLIKAKSRGPAFFAQERIGQGGRPFTMYKFRTMYVDAPAYAKTPQHSHDQRITPVGRWLRKLSLDELPQFWNVLKGDMSVVGPRPEMPQIVAGYNTIQRQRLCVKPGITGVWQISADRKNPIHENIDYDLYYIEKQSFFMDLMIVLITGFYGARGV